MNLDRQVDESLQRNLGNLQAPRLDGDVLRRATRRRTFSLLVAVTSVTLLVGAAAWFVPQLLPSSDRSGDDVAGPPSSSTPSPQEQGVTGTDQAGKGVGEDCTGPGCDELDWALRVAKEAGFDVEPFDGGGAPEIQKFSSYFYFTANSPQGDANRIAVLEKEGYERVDEVEGIPVYFDGVRVTWDVQGLIVWASSSGLGEMDPSADVLKELIRASKRVPWP